MPGFDGQKAMELIEEDLNQKIEEIFISIDKEPISAASLGQVHKAVLKNEEIVAVKADYEASIESKKIKTLKEVSINGSSFKLVSFIPD